MKNKFQKAVSALLCVMILLLPFGTCASAAGKTALTESLDLAAAESNLKGAGYEWKNIEDTLVLNGINLVTEDSFGIHFRSDATTIKITGDNYISAKDHAILCRGSITFEGTGTLTLVSGDTAIQLNAASSETIRFRSGSYDIKGNDYGIYSDTATVAIAGADMKIEGSKASIKAKNINMSSGSVNAVGTVSASDALTIASTSVTAVSGNAPALQGAKKLDINAKRVTAGETLEGLIEIERYGTEKAVKITASSSKSTRSTLFGERYPAFLDYLVFVLLILAIAALIGIPLFIRYRRTQKLIALNEETNKQKKAASPAGAPDRKSSDKAKKK